MRYTMVLRGSYQSLAQLDHCEGLRGAISSTDRSTNNLLTTHDGSYPHGFPHPASAFRPIVQANTLELEEHPAREI